MKTYKRHTKKSNTLKSKLNDMKARNKASISKKSITKCKYAKLGKSVSYLKNLKEKHSEKSIQKNLCTHIRNKYKKVVFTSMGDFSSARQAGKSIEMGYCKFIHDIVIFEVKGIYSGCMIELKTDDVKYKNKIITKRGKLSIGQSRFIKKMSKKGYFSCVAYGLESAINVIDMYMSLNFNEKITLN